MKPISAIVDDNPPAHNGQFPGVGRAVGIASSHSLEIDFVLPSGASTNHERTPPVTSQSPTYRVITSAGPRDFDPQDGYVLPHEHVIIDMRVYWEGRGEWDGLDFPEQALSAATVFEHRTLPQGTSRENLVLADWYVAATELGAARANGCQLVVDLTTEGLDPQPRLAMKAFELAGLPAVLSVGRYLGHSLDEAQAARSAEELADDWLARIETGVDGYRIGMIGEIGTSAEISPTEHTSLRAAARVQASTGLPLNIHVDPFGRQGNRVLDVLEAEGADLGKVALSHCDGDLDVDWLDSLAARGCYVEFDLFGTNHDWRILGRGFNDDGERLDALAQLVDRGHAERLLLSHDICMKNSLKRYGGWGYEHVGASVLPKLDQLLGEELRSLISAVNPLRHLSVAS